MVTIGNYIIDHWTGIVALVATVYGALSTHYAWMQSGVVNTVVKGVEDTHAAQVKVYVQTAEAAMPARMKVLLDAAVQLADKSQIDPTLVVTLLRYLLGMVVKQTK